MPDRFLTAIVEITLELAPWMLLGAVVAGALHVLVPTEWMRRHLAGRGGVTKAVLFGVPLPLCSCGVIPVGLGLKKDGAGNGAVVGFLISTPQTGVDSILVSASFLGLPFALFKVAAAFVTGLAGGWLTDLLVPPEPLPAVNPATEPHRPPLWQSFFEHSLELIQSVWKWLVIGVIVSAAITTVVPKGAIADLPLMSGPAALLVTLVISIPLYVCATASVPIAASLVAGGLPPGAALVFLMAGPATNVATLGAVYRTLGLKSLLIYLGVLVAGSVAGGLIMPGLIDVSSVVTAVHNHSHTSWWQMASGMLLTVLLCTFAVSDLRRWLRQRNVGRTAAAEDAVVIGVQGMTCNGCAAKLERHLNAAPKIKSATVVFEKSQATVRGSIAIEDLRQLVRDAGFQSQDGHGTMT